MARRPDPLRRDEILDASIAYLAQNGLGALSLRRLAAELGCSTNVISYQFGSKEGLVRAALARSRSTTIDYLEGIVSDHPGLSVGSALTHVWEWWMTDSQRLAFPRLNMEAMTASDSTIAPTERADLTRFWTTYFEGWLVRDGHDPDTVEAQATLLLSVLSGLIIDHLSTGDVERPTRAIAAYGTTLDGMRTRSG